MKAGPHIQNQVKLHRSIAEHCRREAQILRSNDRTTNMNEPDHMHSPSAPDMSAWPFDCPAVLYWVRRMPAVGRLRLLWTLATEWKS